MQAVLYLDVFNTAWKKRVCKWLAHTRTHTHLLFIHPTCKELCDWLILKVAGASFSFFLSGALTGPSQVRLGSVFFFFLVVFFFALWFHLPAVLSLLCHFKVLA